MNHLFHREFVNSSIFRLNESLNRIRICFNLLSDDQIWQKPNEKSNSAGNLILHLCGNIRQYAISSLGNRPDVRKRYEEFQTPGSHNREELLKMMETTINEAIEIILQVDETEWLRTREVQGFELTGIGILVHVTEHLSYHVGQIAFWTKQLNAQDLGFYKGIDLNRKNE